MPYFATIYIHPMKANIPHAFLCLTRKHPDEKFIAILPCFVD